MKQFIRQIIQIILCVFLLLWVCDLLYTSVYGYSSPRNKLQYILKTKNKKFDIVFLGSSRVANHIDTKLFDSLSNKKTINLGVMGGQLNDNLLQLKLLIETNKVSAVFMQLDGNYQLSTPTVMGTASAMPFLRNKIIKEHLKKHMKNFDKLYYIPFYRYAINDPKIGFREVFFSLINKKPRIDPSIGFNPKFGNNKDLSGGLPNKINEQNFVLEEIKTICKNNNIKLVLFTAPYSKDTKNKSYLEKLKNKNPELIDLSTGYADSLFYNFNHLNYKGSQNFTKDLFLSTLNKF